MKPVRGRRGQVGSHDQRSAAVERERRGEHPAVANRDELGHARLGLALEQLDRVEPVRRRLEGGVARPRYLPPRPLAARDALRNAQLRQAGEVDARRHRVTVLLTGLHGRGGL